MAITNTKNSVAPGGVVKKERRTLLKLALFGGGAFLVGKLFGSFTDLFSDKVVKDVQFNNFRFVETGKKLTISEKDGQDILVVDKDSF